MLYQDLSQVLRNDDKHNRMLRLLVESILANYCLYTMLNEMTS